MYKIDKIKNMLDCDQCHKLIVEPVFTACGYSVCKSHVDRLEKSSERGFCNQEHVITFVPNRRLQALLNIQLNTLKLTPVYDECKSVIEEAQKNVTEIEVMNKDPENYIYEYFEGIKRQVDLVKRSQV